MLAQQLANRFFLVEHIRAAAVNRDAHVEELDHGDAHAEKSAHGDEVLDLKDAELGETPLDRCRVGVRGEQIVDLDADEDELYAPDLPVYTHVGDSLPEAGFEQMGI